MMSRHFRLSSELTGAIAKRLPHAKNQLSTPGSFFNQFVTYIYIYMLQRKREIGVHECERVYTNLAFALLYTNNNRVLILRIQVYGLGLFLCL